MSDIDRMEARLAELGEAIVPLERERAELSTKLADARSREFIRVNGIKRCDVEMPAFGIGTLYAFSQRMTQTNGCNKRWCEWNGYLHHSSDVIAGLFKPTPGLLEHVPE